MHLADVTRLLPSLRRLQTRIVLLSGGEPLLNPEWADIARLLRAHGLRLWLLTSGLSLAKHARVAAGLFDSISVSLDGTNRATYAAIRGIDAFHKVCEGIRGAVAAGARVGVRVTVQKRNYIELPMFVDLARRLGVSNVSFLAVDVANSHAFGRQDGRRAGIALERRESIALDRSDLPELERVLLSLERTHAEDFEGGFIAESPSKLRRIHQYFSALHGEAPFPPVRCNAPEFSAVVRANGHVQPCFFIGGPPGQLGESDCAAKLQSETMGALRAAIRAGQRSECETCVCSMWRDLDGVEESILP